MSVQTSPIQNVTVRAVLVWFVALVAYVIAVFARTSLSATGIDAALRFGASPAILSLFTVLQVAVYAAMQVPAGSILDRIGARRSIVIGMSSITAGMVLIAFATNVPLAILARVLIGMGDAFVFISVVRLVPAWFPTRAVPLVTQLTGMSGQLGQLLSLGPLVGLILWHGWAAAFMAGGALTLLSGILAFILVRDGQTMVQLDLPATDPTAGAGAELGTGPKAAPRPVARTTSDATTGSRKLVETWQNPGTRAGFWIHFTAPMSAYGFIMLWGFAYMTQTQEVSERNALNVLAVYVAGTVLFAPALAFLTSRFPAHRTEIVMGIVGIQILSWAVVLLWPGAAPLPVLFVLAIVIASGGPGSLIGFDLARTTNPLPRLGMAIGMVNAAGFVSTLIVVFAVGLVLDLLGETSPELFSDAGFTLAWLVQVPLWTLGLIMMRRTTLTYRQHLATQSEPAG